MPLDSDPSYAVHKPKPAASAVFAADTAPATRARALDVMRGLVMLLLLPDLSSGFGLESMARTHPEDAFWAAIAAPMRHVDWEGMALWDLVMPCFAFVIGASMVFSMRSHLQQTASPWPWLARAQRRALVLVLLGLLMSVKPRTLFDEFMPLLLVAVSWPAAQPERLMRRPLSARQRLAIEWGLWSVAILLAVASLAARWHTLSRPDIEALTRVVLVLLGGAYALASLFVTRRGQAAALASLFVAWTLAMALWPLLEGQSPAGAAWLNGSNFAAAADRWLFHAWFGVGTSVLDPHGYHWLQWVPLAMLMLAGALAAQAWLASLPDGRLSTRLAATGAAGLALAAALALAGIPLVKSIWTPTFLACSAALMLLTLAALAEAIERFPALPWQALVVLGSNPILLYVLAYWERWRILQPWSRLGGDALAGAAAPVAQALWVLACLWLLAWALHRARILLRV